MPVTAFSYPTTFLFVILIYLIYFCLFKEALSLQFDFIVILQTNEIYIFRISQLYRTYLYLHTYNNKIYLIIVFIICT